MSAPIDRRPTTLLLALPLALSLSVSLGCRPAPTSSVAPAAAQTVACPEAAAPNPLDPKLRIFDADGREHSLHSLLDTLAEYRVVLLGETHTDDVTHQVEHAVLEGLAERHDDKVVLSMEMFGRDVQAVLDQYVAGELTEAQMLEQASPWSNYRTGYRPLVETARERQLPLVGANAPRASLMRAVKGKPAYDEVRAEHPEWLPETMYPASDAYWDRVDRTIRGHGPPRKGDRTYSVQNLWDNAMADSIVQAAQAHPDHTVVHVVGGFHIERHDGTVAQIRQRDSKLDLATVRIVSTFDLAAAEPAPDYADFVVYTQDYAQGPSGRTLSVGMPASLEYRLSIPEGPAPADGWPLMVWLADDELRPEDAALRWRMALGSQAAVIVVEPPHRTLARQGWTIRRWAWPSSMSRDLSAAAAGLRRIVEYARRRLPVRPDPILVAGEGAGGTLALWTAQYSQDWSGVRVVAVDPQLPHAIRTASIPDDPSGVQELRVLGELDEGTLAGLRGAGLSPQLSPAPPPGDPRTAQIVAALGLTSAAAAASPPQPDAAIPNATPDRPVEVHLAEPSPLATSWAALYTSMLRARGHDARLRLGDAPATAGATTLAFDGPPERHADLLLGVFAEGRGLPRTPDAFGGAVVLMVPRKAKRTVVERWTPILSALEGRQGFIKTPYRAVLEGDDKGLAAAFDELRDKGRTEVLVVPVELCATGMRMQSYMGAIDAVSDGVSIHWLPGLGQHVVDHLSKAEAKPAH